MGPAARVRKMSRSSVPGRSSLAFDCSPIVYRWKYERFFFRCQDRFVFRTQLPSLRLGPWCSAERVDRGRAGMTRSQPPPDREALPSRWRKRPMKGSGANNLPRHPAGKLTRGIIEKPMLSPLIPLAALIELPQAQKSTDDFLFSQ